MRLSNPTKDEQIQVQLKLLLYSCIKCLPRTVQLYYSEVLLQVLHELQYMRSSRCWCVEIMLLTILFLYMCQSIATVSCRHPHPAATDPHHLHSHDYLYLFLSRGFLQSGTIRGYFLRSGTPPGGAVESCILIGRPPKQLYLCSECAHGLQTKNVWPQMREPLLTPGVEKF